MIELQNLGFTYSKKQPDIFSNLSLKMNGGHIYGLLGKNGAGKTTLLKLIAGLRSPKNGSCKVLDMDSKDRNADMLKEIYFLTDEIWFPDCTIDAYLKMFAKGYPNFDHEVFEACIKEFEIERNRKLKNMSFGQQKKVAISFAFATQCRILIMDEPTNGLDIPSKGQFRKIASNLVSDDRCLILSTHQVRDLESLIDQIIILDESRILLNETTDEICNRLLFKTLLSVEKEPNILYNEFTTKGFLAVYKNTKQEESKIDLEILFNFATQQSKTFLPLFQK